MKIFLNYYLPAFTKPSKTFSEFLENKKHLSYSLVFLLIPSILYTLMYIFLSMGGSYPSSLTPWINIQKEVYYSYNIFLLIPSLALSSVFSSGIIHLLCLSLGRKGLFEDIFSVFGLSISVAMWATLLHDLITSFLGAFGFIDALQYEIAMNSPTVWRILIWFLMIVYVSWFIILFSKSVRVVYKFKKITSIFIGTLGFTIFQLVFLIFNR